MVHCVLIGFVFKRKLIRVLSRSRKHMKAVCHCIACAHFMAGKWC